MAVDSVFSVAEDAKLTKETFDEDLHYQTEGLRVSKSWSKRLMPIKEPNESRLIDDLLIHGQGSLQRFEPSVADFSDVGIPPQQV